MNRYASGYVYGTGAALNVVCGFIPKCVRVVNLTDGDVENWAHPAFTTMVYTSGGTAEIKANDVIVGNTSKAEARVLEVLQDTGTWAGGDSAGTLILDALSKTGTFQTETVYIKNSGRTDDASGVLDVALGVDIDTEVATDNGITAYTGSTTAAVGFTLATAISEDAKLLKWDAWG